MALLGHGVKAAAEQRHLSHPAGRVAAAGHGQRTIRRFQGGNVVHTVAHHGHAVAVPLQGADQLPLVVGGDTAEDGILPAQGRIVLFAVQLGKIDLLFRPGDARPLGYAGNRQRTVAGDHFDGNALPAKVFDGLADLGPQTVAQAKQGQQLSVFRQMRIAVPDGRQLRAFHQRQHPKPLRGPLLRLRKRFTGQ